MLEAFFQHKQFVLTWGYVIAESFFFQIQGERCINQELTIYIIKMIKFVGFKL